MERLESEQPILGTSELFSNDRENHSGLALPIPNVSPNPIQASQSSLPELGADLIPTDVANILPNNTVFKSDNGLFRWSEPYVAKPGFDSLTGLSWKTTSSSPQGGIAQKVISRVRITSILSAEASVKETLQGFFRRSDWQQTFQEVFGTEFNKDRAQGLAAAFAKGDFSALPPIEILPASVLNGARGGFDTKTGKIYLSDTLLRIRKGNSSSLKSSLLEEIGHFIDAQVNRNDTPGDEGELFADRLQAIALSGADLLRIKSEDDHATIWLNGSQHVIEQASTFPNFAIRTEGSLRMNGGGDLDGDPLNLQDDALVYAARGFTINGNATLPVRRDANGNIIRDASSKAILVPNALTVATGYTSNTGPTNSYAGINPPTLISPQTIDIPSYTSLVNQTLSSRVPSGTAEVIFNAQTPLNTIADWNSKFPSGGTATNPSVVHVINGGLNIPSNVVLSNTVIKVDSGDINFNGTGQNFTNVVLIATNGNINLNNTNATDLSVFASGSINANGSAKIGGTSLFATGTKNGSVMFNGSTKTVTGTDQLQVIAQGNITYNGSANTRASFLSAGTFTYNGSSTLYGSIGAKGDITFNGKTTVIWASIRPFNQAPTDLVLSPASLAENVLGSSVVGTLSTTDPNPGNTFTYSLVSGTGATDNAVFTIVGNQLKINASPDFEAKSSYSIRVKTTDQDGLSYEKLLTVSITDVNEAPTSLVLSNSITPENVASGSVIGTFTSTDPDANNTFTYSLVTGTGSTDNTAFSIVGNQLKINASPDFEAKSSYSIRVRTTDQGGLSFEKTLTIAVTDLNEAPTSLVLSNSITPENVAAESVIGNFSTTDPDVNNTFTYSLVAGTGDVDNSAFSIIGNELQINASPDFEAKSSYSILVQTTDQDGLSTEKVFTVGILNVNEAPVFTSKLTGNATADVPYEYRITTADPENDARTITAAQLPAWMTLQDNGDGTATLRGTPSFADAGLFTVNLTVAETSTIEHLQGTQTALVEVGAILQEQSNFAPERTLSFTIPSNHSTLSFKINPLTFDLTDSKSINDAFEVALVDAQGKSLLPTLGTGRDSFFNWTEGLTAIGSAGTTYDAATGTVRVNLTGIAPGTATQLVFRLVNDDTDTTTQVRIADLSLTDAPSGTVAPVVTGTSGTSISGAVVPVEFNHLQDVTLSVEPQYQRTSFNDKTNLLYADVVLQNNGTYAIDVPLIVAVNHISDPSVQLRDPDGFTPEGLPYYNFSSLVADGKLDQGEASNSRSLVFYNPNEVQFTYDLVVLAGINQAPVIQSQPNKEVVAGDPYRYDVKATDANNDSLTYELLNAPDGMVINAQTGVIEWQNTADKVGNQSIAVEVSDGRGGKTQQTFSLAIVDTLPNRPPNFTSTPVVDAYINQLYKYDSEAVDPDQDRLTYRLISGPQGIQVDPNTGLITWKPNGTQSGIYDVVLEAVDGNGGTAQQSFQIQTQAEPGNFAPIITSKPAVAAYTSKAYSYDVIAVDPDKDPLTYALINAPTGMTIDSASGKILWGLPINGQSDVTVRVQDNRGGVDTQHFTLNVNNTVPAQVTGQVFLSDYQPTSQVVYYQNFEDTSNPLTEWSHPLKNITPSGNRHFIGQYGGPANGINQGTSLTLNDLPEHDNINLSFKLFVIQSWDGYSPYNYGYTPDEWKLDVEGGQTLLFTSFDNAGRNNQIYPGQIIDGADRSENGV